MSNFKGISVGEVGALNLRPTAGSGGYYIPASPAVDFGPGGGSPTKVFEIYIPVSGTVTCRIYCLGAVGGYQAYARMYVNGAAVGSQVTSNNNSSPQTSVQDISVNAGDLLQYYIWCNTGASSQAHKLWIGFAPNSGELMMPLGNSVGT